MSDKLRKTKDRASKLFGEGKLKDALKLYLEVVQEDPSELACRIKIGDIHRRLGQKAQAVLAYQAVARHYAEDGMLLKAIAVGKLILSVDASHTATQEMLADLYSKRASPARAASKANERGEAELDTDDDEPMIVERPSTTVMNASEAARRGSGRPADSVRGVAWPVSGVQTSPPANAPANVPLPSAELARPRAASTPQVAWPVSSGVAKPVEVVVGAKASEPPRVIVGTRIEAEPPVATVVHTAGSSAPSANREPIEVKLVDDEPDESLGASADLARRSGAVDEPLELGVAASAAGGERPATEGATSKEEHVPLDDLEGSGPSAAQAGAPAASSGSWLKPSSASVPAPSLSYSDPRGVPEIPLFSDLPKEAFIELLVQMTMREMKPGDHVIREGETGNSFFVLAQGKVRVSRKNRDGSETVLAHLTDGAFFGEMALLQDGARTASVIVEEDSQVFEISKPLLDTVVAHYPSVERVLRDFYTQRLLSTTMATHPLFHPFEAKERRHLMEMFKSKSFNAGDVLLKEGQRGDGLYLLLTGTLEVTKRKDGEPIVIAELDAGDMFGEMSLLTNRPTVATITAVTECLVLRLSKSNFDELIMTHPQVLELVSQISEERETENNAIFGSWTPKSGGGAALV